LLLIIASKLLILEPSLQQVAEFLTSTERRNNAQIDKVRKLNITQNLVFENKFHRAMPGAWQGSQIPGGYSTNEHGELIWNRYMLIIFYYFFLARGEWSEDEIRWVVHEDIDQNLEDQAKDQALIFFYKYLEYLQDLSNIQ
jgi:lipase chaperone LimK